MVLQPGEKESGSPVFSQSERLEQNQEPDHACFHQDDDDPQVQLQELRDGDRGERAPVRNQN